MQSSSKREFTIRSWELEGLRKPRIIHKQVFNTQYVSSRITCIGWYIVESARSEPDTGKTTKFSAFFTEYCPRLAVTNTFTKIGSIFRNEFNPSGSEGVLDHSPCVSPEDVDTNKQERVSKSDISSVSPSSERKEKIANRIWQMEYWRLEL